MEPGVSYCLETITSTGKPKLVVLRPVECSPGSCRCDSYTFKDSTTSIEQNILFLGVCISKQSNNNNHKNLLSSMRFMGG